MITQEVTMMMTFQKMMPMSKPLVMEKVGVDLTLSPLKMKVGVMAYS